MATQQWTIITVVGAAVPEIQRRLERWSALRIPDEHRPNQQWPRRTRLAAASLMRQLEQYNATPPVIYFSRHIDLWSSFGELFRLIPHAPAVVGHDQGDVWAYRMPDRGRLLRRTRQIQSTPSANVQESLWLANTLASAATAYRELWRERLILIERKSWSASPDDKELLAAASTMPRWLRR